MKGLIQNIQCIRKCNKIMVSFITLCTQATCFIDVFLAIPVYSNLLFIHLHYVHDDKWRHANEAFISRDHLCVLWAPPPLSYKRICFSWKLINFSPCSLEDPIKCFLFATQHEERQTKSHSSVLEWSPNVEEKCFIRSTSKSDCKFLSTPVLVHNVPVFHMKKLILLFFRSKCLWLSVKMCRSCHTVTPRVRPAMFHYLNRKVKLTNVNKVSGEDLTLDLNQTGRGLIEPSLFVLLAEWSPRPVLILWVWSSENKWQTRLKIEKLKWKFITDAMNAVRWWSYYNGLIKINVYMHIS